MPDFENLQNCRENNRIEAKAPPCRGSYRCTREKLDAILAQRILYPGEIR